MAVFGVGLAIVGLYATRTQVGICNASLPLGVQSYVAPYPDIEAYTDYRDLYLRCLVTPFLNGAGAYSLPIVNNYPPLFIYTLAAFGEINLVWSPAIPLIAFDILTVIPVYLIAKEFLVQRNSKLAFAAALAWSANPLNLLYNDLMWLNTAPTTFFLLLALYALLKERYPLSGVLLAISTGYKQVSFIAFPLFAVLIWKAQGFSKKFAAFLTAYASCVLVISTPYIFTKTQFYLWALSLPILGTPSGYSSGQISCNLSATTSCFSYGLSDPTRITTFLGLFPGTTLGNLAAVSYQYLDFAFAGSYVVLLCYIIATRRKFTKNDIIVLTLAAFLIFFALFGRGVYKYYFTTVSAFGVLFFRSIRGILLFEGFSLAILLLPREVLPWMAVLLLTTIPGALTEVNAAEVASSSAANTPHR
jgi:hypothetical protein